MKHCIVHRRCVEIEMKSSIHPGYKEKAAKAYQVIEDLIEKRSKGTSAKGVYVESK